MTAATIEGALYYRLSNTSGVTDLVGTRIYPNEAPQNDPLPRVIYTVESQDRGHAMSGADGIPSCLFWIDCEGSYGQTVSVSEAVRAAMDGFKGAVSGFNVRGAFLEDQEDIPNYPIHGEEKALKVRRMTWRLFFNES